MHSSLYNLIRPHYRDLRGYVSAGMETSKDQQRIFMNANENPFELPGAEGFNRYPEPQPAALLAAYAKAFEVAKEQLVMSRGADEAIVLITRLFCEPGSSGAITCPPTFGMYSVNAHSMPSAAVEVPLLLEGAEFKLDSKGIVDAVQQTGARVVFLCSPNNPTANSFAHEDMLALCKSVDGKAIVVIDETYIDFSLQASMAKFLEEQPNLIILRTLSKSYSMAGMRMGCLLSGDTDFIELIKTKCLDAYPLPLASIAAALNVLQDDVRELAMSNVQRLLAERERLAKALTNVDHVDQVFPSDANFLLVRMKDAKGFLDYCSQHNIILRDFSGKSGTEQCLRISVGTESQNDRLIELINRFEHR